MRRRRSGCRASPRHFGVAELIDRSGKSSGEHDGRGPTSDGVEGRDEEARPDPCEGDGRGALHPVAMFSDLFRDEGGEEFAVSGLDDAGSDEQGPEAGA